MELGLGVRSRFNHALLARFHRYYYDRPHRTWESTRWMGVGVETCPLDLWSYQEILHETKPEVVVETGTGQGGSALFLASMLDAIGAGEVLTIDIEDGPRPEHPRISYRVASSTAEETVEWVAGRVSGRRTMVILGSDHSAAHVTAELAAYAPMVSPGCYLIVERTNLNGHPVRPDFGPGPAEALDAFLPQHDEFELDGWRERLMMTFNPHGYLLRR